MLFYDFKYSLANPLGIVEDLFSDRSIEAIDTAASILWNEVLFVRLVGLWLELNDVETAFSLFDVFVLLLF